MKHWGITALLLLACGSGPARAETVRTPHIAAAAAKQMDEEVARLAARAASPRQQRLREDERAALYLVLALRGENTNQGAGR